MTVSISQVTFDCSDPYALSQFWAQVTGWGAYPGEPNLPGDDECWLGDLDTPGPALFFQRVPEPKTVKNRLHLDVEPTDGTRDEEVERLIAIGATLYDDRRRPDGTGWVVLADPEGNEFCVERSQAERDEPDGE